MGIKTRQHPVLIQTDCLEFSISEQPEVATARWLRHPTSEEFRYHSLLLVDLLLEYECHYLLQNAQEIHYLELTDQNWIIRQLIPLVSTTSLERQAFVVSQVSLELMDTDRILEHFARQPGPQGKAISTRLFLDTSYARAWLHHDIT